MQPETADEDSLIAECNALILEHGEADLLEELSLPHRVLIREAVVPYLADILLSDAPVQPRPLSHSPSNEMTRIRTGVSSIDAALNGGLPLSPGGMLVEVFGSSGVGKSQFCMQLCASGGVGAVYLMTSGPFPYERFAQVASPAALRAVVVQNLGSVEEMEAWAESRLPWLLEQTGAQLVIVDSVAALHRTAFADGAETERSDSLVRMACWLKDAVASVQGVIVCVNEIANQSEQEALEPALGPAWADCCNARLEIRREVDEGSRRCVTVMHSSFVPAGRAAFFEIGPTGLTDAAKEEDEISNPIDQDMREEDRA